MWNDITLTSQPSDVQQGYCREGGGGLQVLLIAWYHIMSASNSDEKERSTQSLGSVQYEVCFGGKKVPQKEKESTSYQLIHSENHIKVQNI